MATKAQLIRDYLTKYPEVGPTPLATQIAQENKGMKISPSEVSNIKTLMRREKAGGTAASPSTYSAAQNKAHHQNLSTGAPTPANGRTASARPAASSLADQVGMLKDVAAAIGKDEAKKILDLL